VAQAKIGFWIVEIKIYDVVGTGKERIPVSCPDRNEILDGRLRTCLMHVSVMSWCQI
jgi:hypothetical protein